MVVSSAWAYLCEPCDGNGCKVLLHCSGHRPSLDVANSESCGEPAIQSYDRCHSWPRIGGTYSCPSLARYLRKFYIQVRHIWLALLLLDRPSTLDAFHLSGDSDGSWLLQQIERLPNLVGFSLWAFLIRLLKSWLVLQVGKGLRAMSACLFVMRKSLLGHQGAWQRCDSGLSSELYTNWNRNNGLRPYMVGHIVYRFLRTALAHINYSIKGGKLQTRNDH